MLSSISVNEEELFDKLIETREDKEFQFRKTVEECGELVSAISKHLGKYHDIILLKKKNLGITEQLVKEKKLLANVIEEMTDVEMQLHFLRLSLIKEGYINESDFETIKNSHYVSKMIDIRKKLKQLKGEDNGISDD